MARFHGVIGYGDTVETKPGVWEDVVVERYYYGDVLRNTRDQVEADKVNNDTTVGNSISVLADAYLNNHFATLRYIEWMGRLWTVANTEVRPPRLIMRLGGLYNGKRAQRNASPGTA